MRLLAAAVIGLLPLLVLSANLGHTSPNVQNGTLAVHARHGHTWNVRWHGPAQHLRVLHAIKQHDEWVVGNAKRFHFEADLTAFHRREWRHAMRKILWAKANLRPTYSIPHYREWLCIHHYEGAWDDPDPPYYGGLQMDMEFMRTYGAALLASKGTADHWTPLEQMMVAERAYASGRGFWPWPQTARMCGLL